MTYLPTSAIVAGDDDILMMLLLVRQLHLHRLVTMQFVTIIMMEML
jgi:hypothetical protein